MYKLDSENLRNKELWKYLEALTGIMALPESIERLEMLKALFETIYKEGYRDGHNDSEVEALRREFGVES